MNTPTIRTNHIPRPIVYGFELSKKEKAEFDYLDFTTDEGDTRTFFRYKGNVYDLGDCMRVEESNTLCKGWDGYYGETFFSAVVIKYAHNNEYVIVGQVFC